MKPIFGKRCLLDTNILAAYLDRKHPHHTQATRIVHMATEGNIHAIISSQNIIELTAVLTHAWKVPRQQVSRDVEALRSDDSLTIIYPDNAVLSKFLLLLPTLPHMHTMDIFLLATAIVFDVHVIITLDKGFLKNGHIETYIPLPS